MYTYYKMGFYTRIITPGIVLDKPSSKHEDLDAARVSETDIVKTYFTIDKIDIQPVPYMEDTSETADPPRISSDVTDKGLVNIIVLLSSYNSYEERLLRDDILIAQKLTIQGLIDKKFSENLWTKCYIKIKELILNQNTENLKEALTLRKREENPISPSYLGQTDPNTGIVTAEILDTIDTIPTEYQYLLEIDDHFN